MRFKAQMARSEGDAAEFERWSSQAEAAERASGGRGLDPETARDMRNLQAMMEIKTAKENAENNNGPEERRVLLHDLSTKVRELGGEPEYIIPEEILRYGSELGGIKYDDMTDQQRADWQLKRAACVNILRDWIKEHENAPAVKGPEQKVEQPTATGEMKIVTREMIAESFVEIPSGEEWHIEMLYGSTVTININAKLAVKMSAYNNFIVIGNGKLEIKQDSQSQIERR